MRKAFNLRGAKVSGFLSDTVQEPEFLSGRNMATVIIRPEVPSRR